MRDVDTYNMDETQSDIFRFMENIPTQGYLGFSLGSIVLSAFLFLTGRNHAALFVGQWVPSIGMFALVYKLLRPSHERPMQQMRDTVHDAKRDLSDKASSMSSKMGIGQ